MKRREDHVSYIIHSYNHPITEMFNAISVQEAIGKAVAYVKFTGIPAATLTVINNKGEHIHRQPIAERLPRF